MQRVVVPELLDEDIGTTEEVAASLKDLRRVNRWFGGIGTTLWMLGRLVDTVAQREFSLLDVASGCGDVALAAQRWMAGKGIRIELTLLDRRLSHLQQVQREPANGRVPSPSKAADLRRVVGQALALPFHGESFDLVSCSLFAHHLEPQEFIAFQNEALRVCRIAVLTNDLRRHPLSLALVRTGRPLLRSHMSQHDGVASVKRAYTMQEMKTMLAQTSAARVEIAPHYLYRMAVIAWKRSTDWPAT